MSLWSPDTFYVSFQCVSENVLHVMSTSSQRLKSREVQRVESDVLPAFYDFGTHVGIVQLVKGFCKRLMPEMWGIEKYLNVCVTKYTKLTVIVKVFLWKVSLLIICIQCTIQKVFGTSTITTGSWINLAQTSVSGLTFYCMLHLIDLNDIFITVLDTNADSVTMYNFIPTASSLGCWFSDFSQNTSLC